MAEIYIWRTRVFYRKILTKSVPDESATFVCKKNVMWKMLNENGV